MHFTNFRRGDSSYPWTLILFQRSRDPELSAQLPAALRGRISQISKLDDFGESWRYGIVDMVCGSHSILRLIPVALQPQICHLFAMSEILDLPSGTVGNRIAFS